MVLTTQMFLENLLWIKLSNTVLLQRNTGDTNTIDCALAHNLKKINVSLPQRNLNKVRRTNV